ncbi:TELO2-interacting protein 1 homolog [Zophobas morio]|uniref:TELO2-interacting protein 1 homolog n=1 Tax=Zophobas morio TaxID=2755281 RepID=UPI003083B436
MLHPSQKVRLALCRLCGTFLRQSCNTLLKQSLDQILSVLTTYIYDNYDNVKNLAKEEINSLVSVVQDLDAHNLLIVHKLELNFRECLSSLPGLLRTSNDVNKLALVRLLCGYCEILQNRLNTLLSNPLLWNRLSVALMEVLALDDSPNTGIFDLASDISIGRRRFLHFSNANIESAVQSLCRLIGQHCDLYTSFDHFSSVLRTSTTHRKQAAYALNQIFSGAFSLVSQECHIQSPINNLVKLKELSLTFIYELISSRQFQLPVTQEESDLYDGQLPEINIWDNATLCGLLLECFGTCLKILGPECDSILYDLLYPLVEVYTSDSPSVKSSAHAVLQELCSLIFYQEERKYPNIEELLEHNFDYLIDKVSRNLRFLVDYPRTPVVLSLVVQFCSRATLEQFSDVLRDIILLMTNDLGLLSTQLQLYLYSFKSILVKLETCIHPEKDTIEEEAKECTCPFVHLGVSIVDHVLHYLPDDPPALRLEVLQVVAAGARALRQRPRVLMPLIHKMWPGLINRLSDDVAPVRLQTLRTIQELNVCSADFVFRRIEKDVYPSLHSILSNPPKAPDLPPLHVILVTEPVYSFAYKLRCCALEFILGWLAGYQRFSLAVLDSLMMLTLPYLHPLQPKDLFEGALEIYSLLANKHPDVLWTFAHEFTEQLDRYRPASSRLKQYGAQALAVDMRPIAQVLGNIRIP